MVDSIKLFYFDEVRGRGEFLRMVLRAAGQDFEDIRVSHKKWRENPEKMKVGTPYGQLPYVIINGKKHGQSIPLASYFARKFGFYGKTEEDALKQEEVMHLVEDLRDPHIIEWHFMEDADEKAVKTNQLKTVLLPRFLKYFEDLLAENGDTGLFVGTSVTIADMYLYDFLETALCVDSEALKNFPLLQKLFENVKTMPVLKNYLATKPKADM